MRDEHRDTLFEVGIFWGTIILALVVALLFGFVKQAGVLP